MYNLEVKLRFLDEIHASDLVRKRMEDLFDETEPYEIEAGRDIVDLPNEVIYQAIFDVDTLTMTMLREKVARLNKYDEWYNAAVRGRYSAGKRFSTLDLSLVNKYKESLYFNVDDMLRDTARGSISSGGIIQVVACMFWLGFSITETLEIRDEEIRYDGTKLVIRDVEVIDPQIRDVLVKYFCEFPQGEFVKASAGNAVRRIGKRTDAVLFHKPTNGALVKLMHRYAIDYNAPKLTARTLGQSGTMHTLRTLFPNGDASDADLRKWCRVTNHRTEIDKRKEFADYLEAYHQIQNGG